MHTCACPADAPAHAVFSPLPRAHRLRQPRRVIGRLAPRLVALDHRPLERLDAPAGARTHAMHMRACRRRRTRSVYGVVHVRGPLGALRVHAREPRAPRGELPRVLDDPVGALAALAAAGGRLCGLCCCCCCCLAVVIVCAASGLRVVVAGGGGRRRTAADADAKALLEPLGERHARARRQVGHPRLRRAPRRLAAGGAPLSGGAERRRALLVDRTADVGAVEPANDLCEGLGDFAGAVPRRLQLPAEIVALLAPL